MTELETVLSALRTGDESITLLGGRVVTLRTVPAGKRWLAYTKALAKDLANLFAEPRRTFAVTESGKKGITAESFLRWDQVVSAREWGMAFEGTEERVLRIVGDQVGRLTRSAAQVLAANPRYLPNWLPGLVAEPLERLITDVLNEELVVATRARLAEDFQEKTDLRVRYPDLERSKGARVQVSWSNTEEAAAAKAERITQSEEYVLVSPWTLSVANPEVSTQEWVRTFDQAIRHATDSQLGPMARLPEAQRSFLREFVRAGAFETTARMRRRQQR